jgi:hypothetical protein
VVVAVAVVVAAAAAVVVVKIICDIQVIMTWLGFIWPLAQ